MEKKIKNSFPHQEVHWIEVCVKHGNGIEWLSDDMYQAEEYTDFDSLIFTVWLHIRSYKHICIYDYRTIEESESSSYISFSVIDSDTKELFEKYTIHFQLGNCSIKTFPENVENKDLKQWNKNSKRSQKVIQVTGCGDMKTFSSYFKASDYLYNYIAGLDKGKTK